MQNVRNLKDPKSFLYYCEKCGKGFNNLRFLLTHKNSHALDLLPCTSCDRKFTSYTGILTHYTKLHIDTDRLKLSCSTCDQVFTSLEKYTLHEQEHDPVKKISYQCCFCKFLDYDPEEFKKHLFQHITERTYNCELCGKTFMNKETWSSHKKTHEIFDDKFCNICNKCFPGKYFKEHQKRHDKPPLDFKCLYCEEVFDSDDLLNNHLQTHKGDTQYSSKPEESEHLICRVCNRRFDSKEKLVVHLKLICPGCTHHAKSIQSLVNHVKSCTEPKTAIACNACGKQFEKLMPLFQHQQTLHFKDINQFDVSKFFDRDHQERRDSKPPGFECQCCGKIFDSGDVLNIHLEAHTQDNRHSSKPKEETTEKELDIPLICNFCKQRFDSKDHLFKHLKLICPGCTKHSKCIQGLAVHIKTCRGGKTGIPLECNACGRRFEKLMPLFQHQQNAHFKDIKQFNFASILSDKHYCLECGQQFATAGALLRHSNWHQTEKEKARLVAESSVVAVLEKPPVLVTYPCTACGKVLETEEMLKIHELGHSGRSCKVCGKYFEELDILEEHERAHFNFKKKHAAAPITENTQRKKTLKFEPPTVRRELNKKQQTEKQVSKLGQPTVGPASPAFTSQSPDLQVSGSIAAQAIQPLKRSSSPSSNLILQNKKALVIEPPIRLSATESSSAATRTSSSRPEVIDLTENAPRPLLRIRTDLTAENPNSQKERMKKILASVPKKPTLRFEPPAALAGVVDIPTDKGIDRKGTRTAQVRSASIDKRPPTENSQPTQFTNPPPSKEPSKPRPLSDILTSLRASVTSKDREINEKKEPSAVSPAPSLGSHEFYDNLKRNQPRQENLTSKTVPQSLMSRPVVRPTFSGVPPPRPFLSNVIPPRPLLSAVTPPRPLLSAGTPPRPLFSAVTPPRPLFSAGTPPRPLFSAVTPPRSLISSVAPPRPLFPAFSPAALVPPPSKPIAPVPPPVAVPKRTLSFEPPERIRLEEARKSQQQCFACGNYYPKHLLDTHHCTGPF